MTPYREVDTIEFTLGGYDFGFSNGRERKLPRRLIIPTCGAKPFLVDYKNFANSVPNYTPILILSPERVGKLIGRYKDGIINLPKKYTDTIKTRKMFLVETDNVSMDLRTHIEALQERGLFGCITTPIYNGYHVFFPNKAEMMKAILKTGTLDAR